MKKATNIIILSSIFLIIVGIFIFVVTLSVNKWDFTKFSITTISTNTYNITDDFTNIEIEESDCDIDFVYIEGGENKVVVKEVSNKFHAVEVRANTLYIKENDERRWYEKIFGIYDTNITIYINKTILGNLNIKTFTGDVLVTDQLIFENITIEGTTSDIEIYANVIENININITTGDIELNNVTCSNLNLEVSTGDIEIENLNCHNDLKLSGSTGECIIENTICKNFNSESSTGEILLRNVIVDNDMNIKRDTGDVKLDKCDALNIVIETSTGDVRGTLLSNKEFNCKTDTGKIKIPESIVGGKCKINTSTGDIIIDIVYK